MPRSPRLPEGGRSPQTLLRRQAGDSWSEGSSGRRRASRLEGSEEDWAVRVRAWLGLLPGQVQEEQAPGPEPPGPWTEEPGRLQSMGLQRVGHD